MTQTKKNITKDLEKGFVLTGIMGLPLKNLGFKKGHCYE
jgi:hypothetical protein